MCRWIREKFKFSGLEYEAIERIVMAVTALTADSYEYVDVWGLTSD